MEKFLLFGIDIGAAGRIDLGWNYYDMHPKISIITPTFNSASTLHRAIDSIIQQNYSNLEYIVIDGQSTDVTLDVIRRYQSNITRWISEKDRGAPDAVNKGIQLATGDIVGVLNADDHYVHGILSRISQESVAHPEADVFYGDVVYVGDQRPQFRARSKPGLTKFDLWDSSAVLVTTFFVRRRILQKYGFYNLSYSSAPDYELALRYTDLGAKFHYVDTVVNFMSGGGFSSVRGHDITQDIRQAFYTYSPSNGMKIRFESTMAVRYGKYVLRHNVLTRRFVNIYLTLRNRFVRPYTY